MSIILRTLRFTFRWATIYTLWDSPFEIRRQSSFFSDTEASFSFDFSEVCHDVLVLDPLILADDWFTGCFSSVSTLDTGAYSLLGFSSTTHDILSIWLWANLFHVHFRVCLLYYSLLGPEPHSPELFIPSRPRVTFHFDPESLFPILELGALDPESLSLSTQSHYFLF